MALPMTLVDQCGLHPLWRDASLNLEAQVHWPNNQQ